MNRAKERNRIYQEGYRDGVLSLTTRDDHTHPQRVKTPGCVRFFCDRCGGYAVRINRSDRYCRGCGRFIDWENVKHDREIKEARP